MRLLEVPDCAQCVICQVTIDTKPSYTGTNIQKHLDLQVQAQTPIVTCRHNYILLANINLYQQYVEL